MSKWLSRTGYSNPSLYLAMFPTDSLICTVQWQEDKEINRGVSGHQQNQGQQPEAHAKTMPLRSNKTFTQEKHLPCERENC